MTITHIDVIPTLIENTTMQQCLKDGVPIAYHIKPINGYVLHDKAGDWQEQDMNAGEFVTKQAFYSGSCSCGSNYDFVANPREFFTIQKSSAPANEIF